jgi:hypothetical protein
MTILYSRRTLDEFNTSVINNFLTKPDFEEGLKSISPVFQFDDVKETIHKTFKSKRVVETLLHRKTLADLIIKTDEEINALRVLDNEYSKVLASGFDLMFNIALSELYFLTDSFPSKISKEVREINKQVIKDTLNYLPDTRYNEKKHNFVKKNGKKIIRPIHIPFKEVYNQKNSQITPPIEVNSKERSLLALYEAFSHKYRRFKNDVALLNAAVVVEQEASKKGADSALMKLYGLKETLTDIKPNRLAIRYYATRDIMRSFSIIKPGYDLLETIVAGSSLKVKISKIAKLINISTTEALDIQVPRIAKHIGMNRRENLKFEYMNIGYGKYGKRISDVIFWNGVATLGLGFVNGVCTDVLWPDKILHIPEFLPKIPNVIHQVPVVRDFYDTLTSLGYNLFAGSMIIGVFNKIPAKMLEKKYKNLQKIVYM